MISEQVVALLANLRYREDAESKVNILPFGSVYWDDEMPDIKDIFDKPDDMSIIMSMFGLRLKVWDGERLDDSDQRMWDEVQRRVPDWALFRRLNLNDDQKRLRDEAEKQVEAEFESLSRDPDQG